MGYIFIILAICSIIIVIAFPIINTAKKRNQANMHLFDSGTEETDQQKRHSNGSIMKDVFIIAVVYLIVFVIGIIIIMNISSTRQLSF